MKKISISILLYCFTFLLNATNYYVSSSEGNDSNNGLTPETAWKTLEKVENERAYFLPGDVIAFKKGDIWNDGTFLNLSGIKGTAKSKIRFTSYGIGDKPIISVVGRPNINWVNQGNNIWRTGDLHDQISRLMIDGKEVLGSWIYSEINTNISSSGMVASSLVRYVWDDIGDGNFVYLYSTQNPSNMNIKVSVDVRAMSLYNNAFLNFSDIEFQGGYIAGVTVKASENINFDNVKIGVMSRHGLTTEYSSIINKHCKNIIVKNSLIDSEFMLDYSGTVKNSKKSEQHGGADGIALRDCIGAEIFNNIFKNWGHSSLSLTSRNDEKSETTQVKAYKNFLTAPDIAYGGRFGGDRNTHHNEIYNNIIEDIRTSCQMNGYNNHVHHNIFRNSKHSSIKTYSYGEITVQGYSTGSYNNIFENNLFLDSENAGYFVGGDNYSSAVKGHIFRNNIIFNCGSYYRNIGIWIEGNSDSKFSNRENIFQNNIVYNSGTDITIRYYNKNISTLEFNAQSSYGHKIERTLNKNPDFVSESDYHLLENSPAINSGILPLAKKDYDDNWIPYDGSKPDIGIYEYFPPLTGSVIANAGSDKLICLGDRITLTANGGSSYKWSTGATSKSIIVSPAETKTYSVEVTNGLEKDTDQVVVNVLEVKADAGIDRSIELGESITLSANGGDSYSWSTGETTQSITVRPTKNTNYTVTAIKNGCIDTDNVIVTVEKKDYNPPLSEVSAGEDQTICIGESTELNASEGDLYFWSTGEKSKMITVSPSRTTTYTLELVREGVSAKDTVTVVVENCDKTEDSLFFNENSISIYPNPTDSFIIVDVNFVNSDFDLQLINVNGSILQHEKVKPKDSTFTKKIDISTFATGVYFVRIFNSSQNVIKKIILI